MQTPDGNKSSAGSLRVPREQPPDLPPKTQAAYDDVPADIKTHQNGKCAEAQAIASYERENGVLPPAGTRFDARNVRGPDSQPPPLGKHGTPKPACKMCGHVMKQNGWISETGYE